MLREVVIGMNKLDRMVTFPGILEHSLGMLHAYSLSS